MVKQGFVFSFIALVVVLIFGLIISIFASQVSTSEQPDFGEKAQAIDRFHDLLIDFYLPQVFISSVSATFRELAVIAGTHGLLVPENSFNYTYRSLLENGNFIHLGRAYGAMQNRSLHNWTTRFENQIQEVYLADGESVSIIPDYSSIILFQTDPWVVIAQGYFNITVITKDFTMRDERIFLKVSVPIEGFIDPYYAAYSRGALNILFQSHDEILTDDWNLDILRDSLSQKKYYRSPRGSSFLERFQNKTGGNFVAGVESFIDPAWLNGPLVAYNATRDRRAFIDHYFFSDAFVGCAFETDANYFIYEIQGLPSARFDLNSTVRYLGTDRAIPLNRTCP